MYYVNSVDCENLKIMVLLCGKQCALCRQGGKHFVAGDELSTCAEVGDAARCSRHDSTSDDQIQEHQHAVSNRD